MARRPWGRRSSTAGQWLVIKLNPNVIIEMASAKRTTPIATIQTSRSVGYGLTALFGAAGAGGSRRIRDGRAAASSTVFLPRFNWLLTRVVLRASGYDPVSDATNHKVTAQAQATPQRSSVSVALLSRSETTAHRGQWLFQ